VALIFYHGMYFLGIKIDEITKEQALQKMLEFLNDGLPGETLAKTGQYKIFTPNPEMIVKAQKDEYFKKVLNAGDLNLCDGVGLQIFTGIKRIPGVDFMMELCQLAARQGRGVYLLGSGSDEVVEKTAENLQKQFPNLKIVGYDKGLMISENIQYPISNIQSINDSGADILFVAFGMGKQEKWIYENLNKIPNVKIAMGVGGSFDFISGKVKRAPLFLRQIGLEWMYRLIQEPRRFRRIFNATAKFTCLVLKSKLNSTPYPSHYRGGNDREND
jgi:N-acetylglucosaminyldiphosphoundecaprenol N-acetyl-beta-D-mannosaminyltransferase